MKITDVTFTLFKWNDLPPVKFGHHMGSSAPANINLGLVTISTDEGISGHSFLGAAMLSAELEGPFLIRYLKPILMGQNPLDRERLYHRIWLTRRLVALKTIAAVDIALWDLAGKIAGLPIHRLLGSYRTAIPAYCSSPMHKSVEDYIEEALQVKGQGYPAYKLHPFSDWKRDIEVSKAVRKAVGDDYTLMMDSMWGYNYDEALRVGRAIEDLGFHWYEDPLEDEDIYSCIRLREKLEIPLIATEVSPGGLGSYAQWILLKATDHLRGDVVLKGGFTPALKTARMAEGFGMNYEVHATANSLNNIANLHLIAALRNTTYYEELLPHKASKYGVIDDIQIDKDGMVHVPEKPGLGVDIDFDLIKRNTVGILS